MFCALLVFAGSASGDLIVDSENELILDVSADAGEGAFTSYLIIDFAATGGSSHAFAFHWDTPLAPLEPLTSTDMLNAIAAATLLDADISSSEFGSFVTNFAFAGDAGDPGNFWSFSLGEVADPGISWTSAPLGIDDRLLAADSIDGWYNGFTDEFDAIPPAVPTTQIPVPAAGVLLLAAWGISARRRRMAVAHAT